MDLFYDDPYSGRILAFVSCFWPSGMGGAQDLSSRQNRVMRVSQKGREEGNSRSKMGRVLATDSKNLSGSLDYKRMFRFVEHRIGAPRVIRLLRRCMGAGTLAWTF